MMNITTAKYLIATTLASIAAPCFGSGLTPVVYFDGTKDAGAYSPIGPVLIGGPYLFGVTNSGGTYNYGTAYRVTTATGAIIPIHSFTGGAGGYQVSGGLAYDANYNLYGMTFFGGTYGKGVLYEITTTGMYSVLFNFGATLSTSGYPVGELSYDSTNNSFYGQSEYGGDTTCGVGTNGCGTVFKYDLTAGTLTVLFAFHGHNQGALPMSGVVGDGTNLFGVTNGYADGPASEFGTVFELSYISGTWTLNNLHVFSSGDGEYPVARPAYSSGMLYGTTSAGGPSAGGGIVWSLSTTGATNYTVLHDFDGGNGVGGFSPQGTLAFDPSGNLIGVTSSGGVSGPGVGTIYTLSTTLPATYTVLYAYNYTPSGDLPVSGLVPAGSGLFYGVVDIGGPVSSDEGGVYSYQE
jgi:uncharacterized repeat protein (TIGR03803 family)